MGLRMEHDHNKCRSIPSQISWLAQPCQSPYIHCRVDNVNLCDHKKRRHTFSKPRRGPFFRHPRCSPCLACARKRVHKSLKCSHDDQTARPRRETGLTSQDVDKRSGLLQPEHRAYRSSRSDSPTATLRFDLVGVERQVTPAYPAFEQETTAVFFRLSHDPNIPTSVHR